MLLGVTVHHNFKLKITLWKFCNIDNVVIAIIAVNKEERIFLHR